MRTMLKTIRQVGLVGVLTAVLASPAVGQVGPTEIFIPGGAFALDAAGTASYREAYGCASGQCFNAQGVWLPDDRGTVLAGTTFWIPTAWFDQEIEIILYAHSGMLAPAQVRVAYSIGNLGTFFTEELTASVGPEDIGGSEIVLLTTTLGNMDPAPGGSVLANQQYQGIRVGINGDHPDNTQGYGILGLLVKLTGH